MGALHTAQMRDERQGGVGRRICPDQACICPYIMDAIDNAEDGTVSPGVILVPINSRVTDSGGGAVCPEHSSLPVSQPHACDECSKQQW